MEFDYGSFYKRLESEVRKSTAFAASLTSLMEWCAGKWRHRAWGRLAAVDTEKELKSARGWLPRVLKRARCPFRVKGAYFGLGEFANGRGVEFCDLYFGLMGKYDARDTKSQWLWSDQRHYPEKSLLKSRALKEGGLLCNRSANRTDLDTAAYICFSVGFAALLLRHLLDGEAFKVLRGSRPIGVVTGFDSGDLLRLGEITADGFAPNASAMT